MDTLNKVVGEENAVDRDLEDLAYYRITFRWKDLIPIVGLIPFEKRVIQLRGKGFSDDRSLLYATAISIYHSSAIAATAYAVWKTFSYF
jgi:hypothetical protein